MIGSEHKATVQRGVTDCIKLHPDTAITLCITKLPGSSMLEQLRYFLLLMEKRGAQQCASLTLMNVAPYYTGFGPHSYQSVPVGICMPRVLILDAEADQQLKIFSAFWGVQHVVFVVRYIFPLLAQLERPDLLPDLSTVEFRLHSSVSDVGVGFSTYVAQRLLGAARPRKILLARRILEAMQRRGGAPQHWFGTEVECACTEDEAKQ
jgi:hypothetical protein